MVTATKVTVNTWSKLALIADYRYAGAELSQEEQLRKVT